MRILYLGDIMAEPGIELIERRLPQLRKELQLDMVIAQAENVSDGKGIRPKDLARLRAAGVDFCTGGNHSLNKPEIIGQMTDPEVPIIRPANYPGDTPGLGFKYFTTPLGKVLVVSLLGQIVGKDADKPVDNPLIAIDAILESQKDVKRAATVVNLHGDFSSEKIVLGHYLDGRVTAVVGDHWHVATADARILPGGTAHMTDVGMCGVLDSSLGVKYSSIIPRWREGHATRNELETAGPFQLNGLLVTVSDNGLATAVEPIRRIYDTITA